VAVYAPDNSASGGSGVIISPDGYALTNFHVVQPCGPHMRCALNDGNLYDAVIVGIDPTGDVALIKLTGRDDFPAAELGDSDTLRVGQWCYVVGNPFLLATNFQPTVTYGIISGIHRYQYPSGTLLEYADCIQTDASINPGNSGGPLFNEQGQLVGINGRGSFEKRGRVNVGVGYAISINQIKNFLGHLKSGRIVDHATLGATVATDHEGRAVVTNILESSDAYRRGLRFNDEIVSFAGRSITTANAFKNVLGTLPHRWRVPLSYVRDGDRFHIQVRLAAVHAEEELFSLIQSRVDPLEPGPDQDPNPERPKPDEPRRRSLPVPRPQAMPANIAKMYETRRGFANYHFNLLNRGQIWSRHQQRYGLKGSSAWTIGGSLASGGDVRIVLNDAGVTADWKNVEHKVALNAALEGQLQPAGSGGALLALSTWYRLETLGPERFGEVYYFGRAPLAGRSTLADVFVATYDVVEARFYFDGDSSELALIEMYPDSDVDPCEIHFSQYQTYNDQLWPSQIKIVFGDNAFDTITVDRVDVASPAPAPSS
jgi:S1-C subfamily serine protease